MKIRCLLLYLFFTLGCVQAQFYNNGQNSSAVKWKEIDLGFCELIFPSDFEPQAQKLAHLLVVADSVSRRDLKSRNKKISIILQNNTTVANGFVTLAPWRSEFYSVPPQENQGVDWLKNLSIHEYRHIIQMEKFKQGVGNLLYTLFGEQGVGALVLSTTPLWFIEGDAVSVETINTELGRGVYGPFIRELKAQLFELDSMSYEKSTMGSFKDHITDHYKIGYFLVDHIKRNYGEHVIDSLLHCIARNPFVPYPFSYHLKKLTGKKTPELYADLILELRKKWESEEFTYKDYLTAKSADYKSYQNPVVLNDSSFICVKRTYDRPLEIVRFVGGEEQRITIPGRYDDNSLSANVNFLVWSEKRRDRRWEYRDYSEVILYDLKEDKRKRVKRKTKWFSPDLNMKQDEIVVVEQSKSNESTLKVINFSGDVLGTLGGVEGVLYHPKWSGDKILFVQLLDGVSSVYSWNVNSNELRLMFSSKYPISYPQATELGIAFQSSIDGEDKLLVHSNEKTNVLISPEFGMQFPTIHNKEVFYSDYHSQGMRIAKSKLIIGDYIDVKPKMESKKVVLDSFPVIKYYPLMHLFNFHSWAPVSIYPSDQNVKLGLSLFSQNKLSSSTARINYDYDWRNKGGELNVGYTFAHLYPVFFANYSLVNAPNSIVLDTETNFKQEVFQLGSRTSLLFDGSSYVKRLFFQGVYVHSENDYQFKSTYKDTLLKSDNVQIIGFFSTSIRRAKRNINPRWSFSMQGNYFSNLNSSSSALMLRTTIQVPGLYKNHGFKFSYSDQKSTDIYVANYISEPRGYLNHAYKEARKATVDYVFPIMYPDWKIGKLAYIQRFRGSFFYDHMLFNNGEGYSTLQSAGLQVNMEFNPFRYSYLTQLGAEIALTENGGVYVSPIFRILY